MKSLLVVRYSFFGLFLALSLACSAGGDGSGTDRSSSAGSGGSDGAGAGAGPSGGAGGASQGGSSGAGGSRAGAGGSTAGAGGSTAGAGGATAGAGGSQAGASGAGGSGGDTNRTFVNLAVPLGTPLDKNGGATAPATTPPGWVWYPISGSQCRDGSTAGFFVRYGTVNSLLMYLEGGGACDSKGFCDHNPKNVMEYLPGGETILGSLTTATDGQVPPKTGIFDTTHMDNPFLNWTQIYIPYCTGDVYFGTHKDAVVDATAMPAPQQFVGALNIKLFTGIIVATFKTVDRVVLTGASAGGFGAGLNYGVVQDTFGNVPVDVIDDSGPPFLGNMAIAPCIQKLWRDLWGMTDALPSDCPECTNSDGTGLTNIVDYWQAKYHNAHVGLVSSMDDEVIRLFFGAGYMNCAQTDAFTLYLAPGIDTAYPAKDYENGLTALRTAKASSGQFASYYIGGAYPGPSSNHQHIWRDRFYTVAATTGNQTIAAWASDFLSGNLTQVGP